MNNKNFDDEFNVSLIKEYMCWTKFIWRAIKRTLTFECSICDSNLYSSSFTRTHLFSEKWISTKPKFKKNLKILNWAIVKSSACN